MHTRFVILAGITGVISAAMFGYKLNHYGSIFVLLTVTLFIGAWISYNQDLKKRDSRPPGSFQVEAFATDPDTKLVIKALGAAESDFIDFDNIVNGTNLPLKTINKALDWLIMNNLATENKGRHGRKIYELTPKGRDTFKSSLKPIEKA